MTADRWFSASGGFVLQIPRTDHVGPVFAVTAGQDDAGVELDDREAFRLAGWLLRQILGDDDYRIVHSVLHSTRWSFEDVEQARREEKAYLADATADAQEEALDRAREVEDEARYYEEETL